MDKDITYIIDKLKELSYGWIDKDNIKHTNSKRDFYLNNYRFQSVEKTLEEKIGTCWEQVEVAKYYAKEKNIPCDTYIISYNDPTKIAMHTVAIAKKEDGYYWLENVLANIENDCKYKNVEEILNILVNQYPRMYKIMNFDRTKIEIYKYDNPPIGLSFEEFIKFSKTGEKINI